jgi:hypothetical protein
MYESKAQSDFNDTSLGFINFERGPTPFKNGDTSPIAEEYVPAYYVEPLGEPNKAGTHTSISLRFHFSTPLEFISFACFTGRVRERSMSL